MKLLTPALCAAFLAASFGLEATSVNAQAPAPVAPVAAKKKNWTAPAHKMHSQKLVDEIMAAHPELLSVTFQGVPPGHDKVYTMFAGSFPERIGNASDADDIEVITKGVTILDPRHKKTETPKKYVILSPLRDAKSENVGLIVIAFKNDPAHTRTDEEFYRASRQIRDDVAKKIESHASLFEPAR